LSGEGILQAVVSGALAGAAAAAAVETGVDAGASYRGALRRRLGRHLRDAALLQRFNRWPGLLDAGLAAAVRDRRVFDDLVRFGLADAGVSSRAVRGAAAELLRSAVPSRR
jgi:flavin-dependent dehydrogenase